VTGIPFTPYLLLMNSDLIEAIQSSGFKACMVLAGGGSGAAHAILSHPGASRFVLDVQIPYSRESMVEYLGEAPPAYCSEGTARKMATVAFERAARFSNQAIGIACTAALNTTAELGAPDRAFFGFLTSKKEFFKAVEFTNGGREEQEMQLSVLLVKRLAQFLSE
jgi:nicotinamide mononucleotide (NMN) deamidase PncC